MNLIKKHKFVFILIVILFLFLIGFIAFKIIVFNQSRNKVCKPHEYVQECMGGSYCPGGPTREICE